MKPTQSIMSRYKIAQSKNHYENFTVGSLVLGKEMREAIITLYAFARLGDDQYARFKNLLRYCDDAANPAGELILSLVELDNKENVRQSDAICTALALINFAQGVVEDFEKGRIYIPKNEMKRFNLKVEDIQKRNFTSQWVKYKKYWVERNYEILKKGLGLGKKIKGRLGFEIQMVECAALLLLKRLGRNSCNLFITPPKINTSDWIFIFFKVALRSI